MNRRRTVFTALAMTLAAAPAALLLAGTQATAQDDTPQGLYMKRCNTCHKADSTSPSKGPVLNGVFNKKVASVPGYEYSNGLKAKGSERWTEANLNAFLTKPKDWAPGTKMAVGVADEAQRKAIITHLKSLK